MTFFFYLFDALLYSYEPRSQNSVMIKLITKCFTKYFSLLLLAINMKYTGLLLFNKSINKKINIYPVNFYTRKTDSTISNRRLKCIFNKET